MCRLKLKLTMEDWWNTLPTEARDQVLRTFLLPGKYRAREWSGLDWVAQEVLNDYEAWWVAGLTRPAFGNGPVDRGARA